MLAIKILVCTSLLTTVGIASADASSTASTSSLKSHGELTIGAKRVTVGSERSQLKPKPTHVCSVMQGVSYGAALLGFQSVLIVLPSFSSGVGVPVAAIAAGVGVVSSGVGFVAMVAHDVVCK